MATNDPGRLASPLTEQLGPLPEADGTAETNKERHPEGGYTYDEVPAWSEPLVRAYTATEVARAVAAERDATPDQIIELSEALQVRRILEQIKTVAALHPAADMPTPYQAAWQACCEEIFYRATGEQWHMDEDAEKFCRRPANDSRA